VRLATLRGALRVSRDLDSIDWRFSVPSTQKSTTQQSSSPPKKPKSKSAGGASKNGSRITKGRVIAGAAGLAAAAAATAGAVLYKRKGGSNGDRAVFHVKPDGEGWVVKGDGAERASSTHGTKKDALAAGRELAHKRVPSQLVVHKSDGKVQETWSYDPT
jgi:hypothetical protein